MKTILLDRATWDLTIDSNGNIAVADVPYARAQDVATALRTFLGECWYDVTLGMPYAEKIFGSFAPSVLTAYANKVALTVPGVVTAKTFITSFSNRQVTGQVQFTDVDGVTGAAVVTGAPFIPASKDSSYVGPEYLSPSYVG